MEEATHIDQQRYRSQEEFCEEVPRLPTQGISVNVGAPVMLWCMLANWLWAGRPIRLFFGLVPLAIAMAAAAKPRAYKWARRSCPDQKVLR